MIYRPERAIWNPIAQGMRRNIHMFTMMNIKIKNNIKKCIDKRKELIYNTYTILDSEHSI
jgi:hypothetical protein